MSSLNHWLASRMAGLRERGLLRSLRVADDDGLIHFADNDYLALSRDRRVIAAGVEALERYGSGGRASRLITGHLSVHAELEAELANFLGCEAALLFSSGWAANAGVLAALATSTDCIVQDELNHASLLDGTKLSGATQRVFRHGDMKHADDQLRSASSSRHRILATDGVFSMDGDVAALGELSQLCESRDAWLLVDDAHGLGLLGANGRGSAEFLGCENSVDIHVGTLSKALGSQGGFVAGSQAMVDNLIQRGRSFVYSTALSPVAAATALSALRILQEEPERRERVQARSQLLRNGLRELGVVVDDNPTPIVPIHTGTAERALELSSQLESLGFRIPAVRPPTVPHGKSRLRITVSTSHSEEQVHALLAALARALTQKASL